MPPKKRSQPARGAKKVTEDAASTSTAATSSSSAKKAKVAPSSKGKVTVASAKPTPKKPSALNASGGCHFDHVEAWWMNADMSRYKIRALAESGDFDISGSKDGPMPVEMGEKVMRNASTDCLMFEMPECSEEAAEYYSTIFASLKYDILEFNFDGPHDYSQFFLSVLPALLNGRDLSDVELKFTWDTKTPQNLDRLRQALQLIPWNTKIEISYLIKDDKGEIQSPSGLYDDATLRHLVACSRSGKLGTMSTIVTAKGILDAFDAFCAAPDDTQVMLFAHIAVLEEAFRLAAGMKGKYAKMPDENQLCNLEKSKMMVFSPGHYDHSSPLAMKKYGSRWVA